MSATFMTFTNQATEACVNNADELGQSQILHSDRFILPPEKQIQA